MIVNRNFELISSPTFHDIQRELSLFRSKTEELTPQKFEEDYITGRICSSHLEGGLVDYRVNLFHFHTDIVKLWPQPSTRDLSLLHAYT